MRVLRSVVLRRAVSCWSHLIVNIADQKRSSPKPSQLSMLRPSTSNRRLILGFVSPFRRFAVSSIDLRFWRSELIIEE